MAALHRAEWMATGVCPELCLSTACGHGIYVYKGVEFNSDSRPCNAHQSPERQYISFCSKWDFYVQAGEAKGGKKECAITSAPCWVHLMPRYDSITSPAPTNQFHYSWEEQGLGLVMIWSSLFLSFNQITVLWGFFFFSLSSLSEENLNGSQVQESWKMAAQVRSSCTEADQRWGRMAANKHTHTHGHTPSVPGAVLDWSQ